MSLKHTLDGIQLIEPSRVESSCCFNGSYDQKSLNTEVIIFVSMLQGHEKEVFYEEMQSLFLPEP